MKGLLLGAIAFVLACGGAKDQKAGGVADNTKSTPGAAQAPVSGGGSVAGTVTFTGTAPANPKIDMSEEPACKSKYTTPPVDPVVVVHNGNLQNVFVYVKSGLPANQKFEAQTREVELDQEGCLYQPRVLGVMVNQPIKIKNSDPVLHNIKAVPKKNRGFNISQPQQGMETERAFATEETPVPIECNVHGWMHGDVFVMSHPFFAVSDENGSFKISGLPPGTYTIEAWHEKLGTKTATVTVTGTEEAKASFSFGT
ncbi:MAG: hypothetical protein HY700_12155 [Gemmatimonadetes bacterium]|nr:hypothetical protein [Gemmatimonadota bacterium]